MIGFELNIESQYRQFPMHRVKKIIMPFCCLPALSAGEPLFDKRWDHLAAVQAVDEPNKMPNRLIFKDDKQQYLTNGLAHLKRETPQKFDCQIIAGLL